ncbi:MAG: NAD(P)-dependent oxidoreductase [SAR324 cluster bacterium]|nr:NAD(P)-dependent oxidoreductase [SAR324 cluster bacterium]
MKKLQIGIIHPGEMGVSVAASAKNGGHEVYWVSENRSEQTRDRASQVKLTELPSLKALCEKSAIIISVCPPDSAEEVADEVLNCSFRGTYLDANAISTERVERIAGKMADAGATFVDGGIIGGPAWMPGTTWLYLSGSHANEVADCFSSGPLETKVIGDKIGKASALKMCFAANTKGTAALMCSILATAEALEVREDLLAHWSMNGSKFSELSEQRIRNVTGKAWRFAGEMEEIAATFEKSGIPGGFFRAASEIYSRISEYKNAPTPAIKEVLATLLSNKKSAKN